MSLIDKNMDKEKFKVSFHNILKRGRLNILKTDGSRCEGVRISHSKFPDDWCPKDVLKEVEKESYYE